MTVGFDNLPLHYQLSLYLPFDDPPTAVVAGTTPTYDRAKPMNPTTLTRERGHTFILTGAPAWGYLLNGHPYLDFTGATPDYLTCPDAESDDLDFQSETFSGGIWMYIDALGATTDYYLYNRGLAGATGWEFYVATNASSEAQMVFSTSAGAAAVTTLTATGVVVISTWYLVGFSRGGTASGDTDVYINGENCTMTAGAHANPVTAALPIRIGVNSTATSPYDGRLSLAMLWGERALTAVQWRELFNKQRDIFGV